MISIKKMELSREAKKSLRAMKNKNASYRTLSPIRRMRTTDLPPPETPRKPKLRKV